MQHWSNQDVWIRERDTMSRLIKTANPGDTLITVEPNLDWDAGDQIALAPNTMRYNDSDYAIITSYNSTTGVV